MAKTKHRKPVKPGLVSFDLTCFTDAVKAEGALRAIEAHLASAEVDKQGLLSQLLREEAVFEYVVSALPDASYARLAEACVQTVPAAAEEFEGSSAHALLTRLSNYSGALPLPVADSTSAASHILQTLAAHPFPLVSPRHGGARRKGKGRRGDKAAQESRAPELDEAMLAACAVELPTNRREADAVIQKVLNGQRDLLKSYLDNLRKPQFAATIKSLCFNRSPPVVHAQDVGVGSSEEPLAEALRLEEAARRLAADPDARESDTNAAFTKAAQAFHQLALENKTAYGSYFQTAARYYIRTSDHAHAALCFEHAGLYNDAARHYRLSGSFDDAVRIVDTFDVELDTARNVVDVSAVYFLKSGQAWKAADVLGAFGEALECAETYGLDAAKATLLEQRGRYADAAFSHLDAGDLESAVRLALRASLDRHCFQRVKAALMDEFWSFSALSDTAFDAGRPRFQALLSSASRLLQSRTPTTAEARIELSMLSALAKGDAASLLKLGTNLSGYSSADCQAAGLVCLDQAFMQPSLSLVASSSTTSLQQFSRYAGALEALASSRTPTDNAVLQRLLAFSPVENGDYRVRRDSLLFRTAALRAGSPTQGRASSVVVQRRDLARLLREEVLERLAQRRKLWTGAGDEASRSSAVERLYPVPAEACSLHAPQLSEGDIERVKRAVDVYLRARTGPPRSALDAVSTPSKLFAHECKAALSAADSAVWHERRRARVLFWALPHLSAGLRALRKALQDRRSSIARQLADPKTSHLRLEALMNEVTTLSTLVSDADRLAMKVAACAERAGAPQDKCAEALATEVESFMSRPSLPADILLEWSCTVQVGIAGIRREANAPLEVQEQDVYVYDDLEDLYL